MFLPSLLLTVLLVAGLAGCAGGPSGAGPETAGPDMAEPGAPGAAAPQPALEYLGMAVLPKGLVVDDTVVGGLSALAHDPAGEGEGAWLALSDDGGAEGPARLYRLELSLDGAAAGEAGRLGPDGVEVVSAGLLLGPDAAPYAAGTVDPEGIVLLDGDTLLISSEGNADAGLPPFLGEFSRTAGGEDVRVRRYFEVPRRFVPRPPYAGGGDGGRPRGVRHNLAFEALTLTPGGDLWVGVEGPLAQDGPRPAAGTGARARLLRYDVATGRAEGEVLYPLDPLPVPPAEEDGFAANGVVELLALSDTDLLVLERAWVSGRGHFLRLYRVSVAGAADSSHLDALPLPGEEGAPAVLEKSLILDLADLGEELYNVEGMALGPELADGRRLLLLVSDDNFAPEQRTQFFAFATDPARLATAPPPPAPEVPVARVQGAAHVSPWVGRAAAVTGVVTAVTTRGSLPGGEVGMWIQDPDGDGDAATSEGLFVALAPEWAGGAPPSVEVGDEVVARGRVMEVGRRGGLPVTVLSLWPGGGVEVVARAAGVPAPVRLGDGGLCPPAVIDDDGLARFEPGADGIDFWESLEGMWLELAAPRVVGPTSRYGEIFAVAEGCARGTETVHGGLLLEPGQDHPERVALAPGLAGGRAPELRVGQSFPGPLSGVLTYDFENFRLLPAAWPVAEPAGWEVEATALGAGGGGEGSGLTIASLNLENLSAVDRPEKFARLAETVVAGLASPAIVGLQEVQDDSGGRDDGVVTSAATLDRFADAVVAAGGPRYAARWVDPENNADGGRPGGNIRVAFLYDPSRVDFVDRGAAGPGVAVALEMVDGRPALDTSPGRLEPGNPAFENSRKPLVAEVEVDGETLFLVNNHFGSKGGDDGLYGAAQPPGRPSDAGRVGQARVVADFVGRLLAADPGARVMVLGDLNDFPWRETLAPLGEVGLVNLVERLPAADRYTYVWQGNSQVLDHVLVSGALAEGAEVDAVHRHADLPDSDKPSDHDPVVVRVRWP